MTGAKKGEKFKVLSDEADFFQHGDTVISLETTRYAPYCVHENNYNGSNKLRNYEPKLYHPMALDELERVQA